jgi:2-methylcitrate dehydratase PrpD
MLRAGGTRGAFGTDGKAIQVGLAAAAGVQAALLARAGATVGERAMTGSFGFESVFGATWTSSSGRRAIERNWIKLHPSCLGTHAPIEGAADARDAGHRLDREPLVVVVHPVARQAAHLDVVHEGLEAKFSIPYCVAHTLARRAPRLRDFDAIDPAIRELAEQVTVALDASLPEFGAVLRSSGRELARVPGPKGSPMRPASPSDLAAKVTDLAGDRLDGLLDDLDAPARTAVAVLT